MASRRPPARCSARRPRAVEALRRRRRARRRGSRASRAGSVVGLVGPNGSGKTTLLHVAAGPRRPVERRRRSSPARRPGRARRGSGSRSSRTSRRASTSSPSPSSSASPMRSGARTSAAAASGGAARRGVRARRPLRPARSGALRAGCGARRARSPPSRSRRRSCSSTRRPRRSIPRRWSSSREAVAALARGGCGVLLATQDLHFAARVCDEVVLLAPRRGRRSRCTGRVAGAARGSVDRGRVPRRGRRGRATRAGPGWSGRSLAPCSVVRADGSRLPLRSRRCRRRSRLRPCSPRRCCFPEPALRSAASSARRWQSPRSRAPSCSVPLSPERSPASSSPSRAPGGRRSGRSSARHLSGPRSR